MSKKKNNQTAAAVEEKKEVETEVTETPVTDTVETPVVEGDETEVTSDAPVTETPAVDGDAEKPVETEVEVTEGTSETPVTDETPVVEDDADKPEVTEVTETPVTDTVETPVVEGDENQESVNVDASKMNEELMKSYKVRFAFSQNSKKYAALRNMTLYNMIEIFMTNRQGFVGCTEQKDFDHIKDFVLHNPIIYKYQEFKLEGRKQFIARLEQNTDYVINFLK